VLVVRYGCAKAPEMFCCVDIPCIFLILNVPCMRFRPIQGLPDVGTQEVPKRVGFCMSILFIFQCR
jgi:hypothetical protein